MTTETETIKLTIDDLVYWGEEGERVGAQGHHDLAEFTRLADEMVRRDADLPDDELPSAFGTAYRTHWRTMTREWFDEHGGWRNCTEDVQARRFTEWLEEGAVEPCSAGDPGADAWTMIETGA